MGNQWQKEDPPPGDREGRSGQNRWSWLAVLVLVVGVIVYGMWGSGHSAAVARKAGFSVGDMAPAFTLPTLSGGRVSLAQFRGRPVWINFWATWCTWCNAEMPQIQALHRKYGSRLVILGVDATFEEQSTAKVATYAQNHGVKYPVLLDNGGGVMANYGVRALPTSIFIDPQGVVQGYSVGALSQSQMEAYVKNLGL